MRLALALGRRGLGRTWPNPAVGAVVVKDGVIRRAAAGRSPAAVRMPKSRRSGAPKRRRRAPQSMSRSSRAAHQGKSPPCADAIIKAGIARVVSALEDPNPEVAGQGHERLRGEGHRGRGRALRRGGARAFMPGISRA